MKYSIGSILEEDIGEESFNCTIIDLLCFMFLRGAEFVKWSRNMVILGIVRTAIIIAITHFWWMI